MNVQEEVTTRTIKLERAEERLADLHKAAAMQQHQIRMQEELIEVEKKHLKELQDLIPQEPEVK